MSNPLSVRWTVTTLSSPRPWLRCPTCATARPFVFSGKARLNANGRRLDAWLIYRCASCAATWNRPVLERRAVADVPPDLFDALQANDGAVLAGLADRTADLGRFTRRIDTSSEVSVQKRVTAPGGGPFLVITLVPEQHMAWRADRIVSGELHVSRARLSAMARGGRLRADGKLTRPLRAAVTVWLDLTGLPDAALIRSRAAPG